MISLKEESYLYDLFKENIFGTKLVKEKNRVRLAGISAVKLLNKKLSNMQYILIRDTFVWDRKLY